MSYAHKQRARDYWATGRPLQAGKMVYDQLSKDYRPHWAGNILDLCRRRFPRVREVDDVYFISCDHTHWPRARKAVDAVLALTLSETAPFPGAHLLFRLAENTAKVIDSACGA